MNPVGCANRKPLCDSLIDRTAYRKKLKIDFLIGKAEDVKTITVENDGSIAIIRRSLNGIMLMSIYFDD